MTPPRRRPALRPLSELIRPAVGEAMQAQGFAASDVLARWPDIVGERLAARCMPVRIVRATRPKGVSQGPAEAGPLPATLVLKVESAFAHEVEIAAAQILERVNATFGWRVVGQLRLRQGPVERSRSRIAPALPPLEPGRRRALDASVQGIEDAGLREALGRLGHAVMSKPTGKPR